MFYVLLFSLFPGTSTAKGESESEKVKAWVSRGMAKMEKERMVVTESWCKCDNSLALYIRIQEHKSQLCDNNSLCT